MRKIKFILIVIATTIITSIQAQTSTSVVDSDNWIHVSTSAGYEVEYYVLKEEPTNWNSKYIAQWTMSKGIHISKGVTYSNSTQLALYIVPRSGSRVIGLAQLILRDSNNNTIYNHSYEDDITLDNVVPGSVGETVWKTIITQSYLITD